MFLYGKDRKKEEHTVKILFYDTKSYDKESFEAKAKDYPDIQILAKNTANWSRSEAMTLMETWITTYGDDIDAACGQLRAKHERTQNNS